MAAVAPRPRVRHIDDVGGWFSPTDQAVMDWVLRYQERTGVTGGLLEMGAYLGKTTILIGLHRRPDERFVVCDLFGTEPPTAGNQRTAAWYTANLTREAFEANYAAFHAVPPEIVQAPTSALADQVQPGSYRFVHIDACHLFDNVREDMATARKALTDDGVVVFDDIRAEHTPGVPAAVWPEVLSGGLNPVCITPRKLYATWGPADRMQSALTDWLEGKEGARHETLELGERRIVRIGEWDPAPPSPVPTLNDATAQRVRALRSGVARVVVDLSPPVLTRALRKARTRRRA